MIKRVLFCFVFTTAVFFGPLAGLSSADQEVTLRYSLQGRNLRIVLECKTQRFVQRAEVRSSYSLVKVQFPGEFILNSPKIPPHEFEFNKKGPNLYLNIKNLKWLKIMRLRSPPRLVIDAFLYGERPEEKAAEMKPEPQKPIPATETEKIKKIVLDPGHGGADLGIYTATFTEKQIVLRVAFALRRSLVGKITLMTRGSDRTVGLMKRILKIRQQSPDLAISIHMGGSDIFSVYIPSEEMMRNLDPMALEASQMPYVNKSRRLGSLIKKHLQSAYVTKHIDLRDGLSLPILTYVNCPVVLIELPSGDFINYNSKEIAKIVRAIKEAIQEYEGQ